MCSKKADFWFKWQWMFSLWGAYLQVSKQKGSQSEDIHMLCIRKHIFLMSFFEWLSLKELLHNIAVLLLLRFIPYCSIWLEMWDKRWNHFVL